MVDRCWGQFNGMPHNSWSLKKIQGTKLQCSCMGNRLYRKVRSVKLDEKANYMSAFK